MLYSSARSIATLRQQSEAMRQIVYWPPDRLRAAQPGVSGWSAAEHLDHNLKVALAVLGRLVDEKPIDGLKRLSFIGHLVLMSRFIPRHKVKAPSRVKPVLATIDELHAELDALDVLIARVSASDWKGPRAPWVPHPYLGGMDTPQSLRFVTVHTNHHLKIVRDIARVAGSSSLRGGDVRA